MELELDELVDNTGRAEAQAAEDAEHCGCPHEHMELIELTAVIGLICDDCGAVFDGGGL